MTYRTYEPRELSGYRHDLQWMPTRLKLGRYLFLANLGLFVWMLVEASR